MVIDAEVYEISADFLDLEPKMMQYLSKFLLYSVMLEYFTEPLILNVRNRVESFGEIIKVDIFCRFTVILFTTVLPRLCGLIRTSFFKNLSS